MKRQMVEVRKIETKKRTGLSMKIAGPSGYTTNRLG